MIIKSSKDMVDLGKFVGSYLKMGDCLLLRGDLASGKTTFTKGIGEALGVKGIINSPTFTIQKIYEGDIILNHIDAYRLKDSDYDLGLDENFDESVTVIEWPEFYPNLPNEYLGILFKYIDDENRQVDFFPKGKRYEEIMYDLVADLIGEF